MTRLKDKVAIVTGAGLGIGEAVATLFAKEGAKVAVVDINEKAGQEVAKKIQASGGIAQFWKMDVGEEHEVKLIFEKINVAFGSVDILVNNAGLTGVDKPTHLLSEEEWDKVFNVDVKGVFFCSKYAIQYMLEQHKGSIVNVSSTYGLIGSHELTAYHAAKGAVTIMTKQDAVTYAKDNIRVNSVHPGTIMTELVKGIGANLEGGLEEYKRIMETKHPIGHAGEPEDVAYGILYLASDEAKFTTGAQLVIDGGYTAQ